MLSFVSCVEIHCHAMVLSENPGIKKDRIHLDTRALEAAAVMRNNSAMSVVPVSLTFMPPYHTSPA
jgi:hypothetical protein